MFDNELLTTEFAPPRWSVDGLIPDGCTHDRRPRKPGWEAAPLELVEGHIHQAWDNAFTSLMWPEFEAACAPLPEHLAVSCSWPSGNSQTVIGECWVAEASSRGYVEVFISPVLDQVAGVQGVLVTLRHELVHAAGRRGHGREFGALGPPIVGTFSDSSESSTPEQLIVDRPALAAGGPSVDFRNSNC